MEKSNLLKLGVSENVANFILVDKANKMVNAEGLEVGDVFTITGISPELGEFNGNSYVNFQCTGARDTISLGKLLGTAKVSKYFTPEVAEKAIVFPRRMAEAVEFVLTNLVDKPIMCIGIAEGCGQYEQTFACFSLVK